MNQNNGIYLVDSVLSIGSQSKMLNNEVGIKIISENETELQCIRIWLVGVTLTTGKHCQTLLLLFQNRSQSKGQCNAFICAGRQMHSIIFVDQNKHQCMPLQRHSKVPFSYYHMLVVCPTTAQWTDRSWSCFLSDCILCCSQRWSCHCSSFDCSNVVH